MRTLLRVLFVLALAAVVGSIWVVDAPSGEPDPAVGWYAKISFPSGIWLCLGGGGRAAVFFAPSAGAGPPTFAAFGTWARDGNRIEVDAPVIRLQMREDGARLRSENDPTPFDALDPAATLPPWATATDDDGRPPRWARDLGSGDDPWWSRVPPRPHP